MSAPTSVGGISAITTTTMMHFTNLSRAGSIHHSHRRSNSNGSQYMAGGEHYNYYVTSKSQEYYDMMGPDAPEPKYGMVPLGGGGGGATTTTDAAAALVMRNNNGDSSSAISSEAAVSSSDVFPPGGAGVQMTTPVFLARLFGRDNELTLLERLYENIRLHALYCNPASQPENQKTPLVVLVHGPSGTGKTALVEEFGRRLNDRFECGGGDNPLSKSKTSGGKNHNRRSSSSNSSLECGTTKPAFVSGKVDALQRHIPYAVVVQALEDLGRTLYEEKLSQQKIKLQQKYQTKYNKENQSSTGRGSTAGGGSSGLDGDNKPEPSPQQERIKKQQQKLDEAFEQIQQLLSNEAKVLTHLVPSLARFLHLVNQDKQDDYNDDHQQQQEREGNGYGNHARSGSFSSRNGSTTDSYLGNRGPEAAPTRNLNTSTTTSTAPPSNNNFDEESSMCFDDVGMYNSNRSYGDRDRDFNNSNSTVLVNNSTGIQTGINTTKIIPEDPSKIDDEALSEKVICLACVAFLRTVVKLLYFPLVWFVDDLQWADPPSLRLLRTLVQDDQLGNILLIVGFRDDIKFENDQQQDNVTNAGISNKQSNNRLLRAASARTIRNKNQSNQDHNLKSKRLAKKDTTPGNSAGTETLLLLDFLRAIPNRRGVSMPLQLGLTQDLLTEWISHLLTKPKDAVRPLSEHIHSKTDGNPYFVLQYMELLQRKKLLTFCFNTRKWEWNMIDIITPPLSAYSGASNGMNASRLPMEQMSSKETVTEVVKIQLASMPFFVQQLLQVAACLGFFFDEYLLRNLLQTCDSLLLMGFSHAAALRSLKSDEDPHDGLDDNDLMYGVDDYNPQDEDDTGNADRMFFEAIYRAEQEGLIQQTNNDRIYKFAHDNVREAVYDATGDRNSKELALLHLRIGKHIQELEDDRYIMDAVDQLNRGSSLLIHEMERLEVIRLNLEASSQARMRAGVNLMADYLDQATQLVKERDWERSYDLVLDVYSRSAEAEYARGNFVISQERIDMVLSKAKKQNPDTIRVRYVRMQKHASERRFKDAIQEARRLLTQLGEKLPQASRWSVGAEYRKTSKLLSTRSDDDLLNLPRAVDPLKRWVIRILRDACVYGWNCDPAFCSLLYLRLMRATLLYGSTDHTPSAIAAYGIMAVSMGHISEGARMGELALKLIESCPAYKYQTTAAVVWVYTTLGHLQKPLSHGLDPLLSAYRVSVGNGDLVWGSIAVCDYALLYMFCGNKLQPFVDEMRDYGSQLCLCGQDFAVAYILPKLRFAMNMLGMTTNASKVDPESCKDILAFSDRLTLDYNTSSGIYFHYMQMFNAYILGDVEVATQAARGANQGRVAGITNHSNFFHSFLDGLVHLDLYRKTKARRNLRVGNKMIKFFTELEKKEIANCQGMLKLLKAEKASIISPTAKELVHNLYVEAIANFQENNMTHFNAIANERVGEYMLRHEQSLWAQHYLLNASILFGEWGAVAKVKSMAKKYDFVAMPGGHAAAEKSLEVLHKFDAMSESAVQRTPSGDILIDV